MLGFIVAPFHAIVDAAVHVVAWFTSKVLKHPAIQDAIYSLVVSSRKQLQQEQLDEDAQELILNVSSHSLELQDESAHHTINVLDDIINNAGTMSRPVRHPITVETVKNPTAVPTNVSPTFIAVTQNVEIAPELTTSNKNNNEAVAEAPASAYNKGAMGSPMCPSITVETVETPTTPPTAVSPTCVPVGTPSFETAPELTANNKNSDNAAVTETLAGADDNDAMSPPAVRRSITVETVETTTLVAMNVSTILGTPAPSDGEESLLVTPDESEDEKSAEDSPRVDYQRQGC